jgi:predicted NBD/HSP70 family sugar kinase
VSALLADLLASGAVTEEARPSDGAPGRTASLLRLDPAAAAVLGVDFGHRHVRVAVADLAGRVLAERRLDLDVHAGVDAALDTAVALASELLGQAGVDRRRILGAGMGVPAPIDSTTGRVEHAAILVEWEAVRPGEALARRLELPVRVTNDANLGALAEFTSGAGRGFPSLLYIKISTGLGAGLILDGELLAGATGIAGEIGHLGVDSDGVICRCGNRGCLETVASSTALRRVLAPMHGQALTTRGLVALVDGGDAEAIAAVERAGAGVGDTLAGLCTSLDFNAIVIGGDLGTQCGPLRAAIQARVRERALPPTGDLPVLCASLGERAEVLGAITLALAQRDWLRAAGVVALLDDLPAAPVA